MPRRRRAIPKSIYLPPRWRRSTLGVIAAVIVTAVLALEQTRWSPGSSTDMERYHEKMARVVHVADGDTIDIDIPDRDRPSTRIRLWGVDTPEVAHNGMVAMYFGDEAKAFAERTVGGHDVFVVLSPTKSRDKYGRLLAYVYMERGGRMFNEELIADGFGYADRRFKHPFDDDFENAEKQARMRHDGLWNAVTPAQMPEWRQRMERK